MCHMWNRYSKDGNIVVETNLIFLKISEIHFTKT